VGAAAGLTRATAATEWPSRGYLPRMAEARYSDEQVDAAIDAISKPGAFTEVERAVARAAPRLQGVLAEALGAGGWFDEAHEAEVLKAATLPDGDERLRTVRTMLADEARMGMMVGVAVGWALADELQRTESRRERKD
jgi:hypothetical protein